MSDVENQMLEEIKEADMVLVGIGEEFSDEQTMLKETPEFLSFMKQYENKEELKWMLPYFEKFYYKENKTEKIKKAYEKLEELLDGKNYFIVSTRMDDYIYGTGLRKDRVVTPCGGYRLYQCEAGCDKEITEADAQWEERVYEWIKNGGTGEELNPPKCAKCGKKLVFNNLAADNYVEEGYLFQWDSYTKWLQGTINKKLCVIEMGVGMQFPTVIRWPFEKIVFFNKKASFFRIHSKLYQLSEEIKDKGYKIEEKPTDFLLNKFV